MQDHAAHKLYVKWPHAQNTARGLARHGKCRYKQVIERLALRQLLAKFDANKNGTVSADEFRAPDLAKFNRADTNRDGVVSPAEARAAAGQK